MNKIFNICTLIFSMLILFSCEPGRAENGDLLFGVGGSGGSGGGGGTPAGRLLTKTESHTIDLDTGEMTDESLTYQYDGNKLISTTDMDGNVTHMVYNANNRISKMTNDSETATLEYTGSNVTKMTSDVPGILKTTATYTYTGNQVSKVVTIHEFLLPFPMKTYLEGNYTYSGSNITKSVIKTGVYNPVTGDLEMSPDDIVIDVTFDSKNSPYKLLPTEFVSYMNGMAPQGAFFHSANNFLQIKKIEGGVTNTTVYTHIYDTEGYPSKSTSTDNEYINYTYK